LSSYKVRVSENGSLQFSSAQFTVTYSATEQLAETVSVKPEADQRIETI